MKKEMMKKLINNLKHNQLLQAFLGLLMLSYIIWSRFIRVRLPKDLPLTLTDLKFILLSFTCLIFLSSLYIIVKNYFYAPKTESFTSISTLITESLQSLDRKIKEIDYIWFKTRPLHIKILKYVHKNIYYSKLLFLLFHITKIIVPFGLIIDIFYFQEINVFYKLLPLLFLPLIYRYVYHSLHFFYNVQMYKTDKKLTVTIYEEINNKPIYYTISEDPIHYLIQETTVERIGIRDSKHMFHITLSEDFVKQNPNENLNKIFDEIQEKELTLLSKIYEVLSTSYDIKTQYKQLINIYTVTIYCICWNYIFFTGYYNLSEEFLLFCNTLKDCIEPFSGLVL